MLRSKCVRSKTQQTRDVFRRQEQEKRSRTRVLLRTGVALAFRPSALSKGFDDGGERLDPALCSVPTWHTPSSGTLLQVGTGMGVIFGEQDLSFLTPRRDHRRCLSVWVGDLDVGPHL